MSNSNGKNGSYIRVTRSKIKTRIKEHEADAKQTTTVSRLNLKENINVDC